MSQAVWVIVYRVAEHNRAEYLAWFHAVHVAEKLARPGYTWASHYTAPGNQPADETTYIALFGGATTRTFYDPSPGQLKLGQDALTKTMMGYRISAKALVLCEEWRARDDQNDDAIEAAAIRFQALNIDAGGADPFAAWSAQAYFPELVRSEGFTQGRKLLAAFGAARHVLIEEFTSTQSCAAAQRQALCSLQQGELAASVSEPLGEAISATRIWPPLPASGVTDDA